MVRPLKETFRKNGFDYFLVKRSDKWAIYSQSFGGVVLAWEVVRCIKKDANAFCSMAHEEYPSTSRWGIDGWTYMTFEKAEEKYNKLLLSKGKRDSKINKKN